MNLRKEHIEFIEGNLNFVKSLNLKPENNYSKQKKRFFKNLKLVLLSIMDVLLLKTHTLFQKKISFVFLTPSLSNYDKFIINISQPKNIYFINYHPTKYLNKIGPKKVYNTGIFYNAILRVLNVNSDISKRIRLSQIFNISFFAKNKFEKIFIPSYFDLLGMSIILFKKRNFEIGEVQHGSIINFYPYQKAAPFRLVDVLYVNNIRTMDYLKNNLYKNIEIQYVIKNPEFVPSLIEKSNKYEILYCSSIETKGFHQVFMNYISKAKNHLPLKIRLHPREIDNITLFENDLKTYKNLYDFDFSKYWYENINDSNLIIVTPWSSIAEEAFDLNLSVVIVDKIGENRYKSIIDNEICFFSQKLEETLNKIIV